MRHARLLIALVVLAAVAGCLPPSALPSPSPTGQDRTLGAAACAPPSPTATGNLGPDLEGTVQPRSAPLWARLSMPPTTGLEEKVILRVGGTGPLVVFAEHVDATRIPLDPRRTTASPWDRPGEEWGLAVTFPKAGCWRLHVQRPDLSGDFWVVVRAP